MFTRKIHFSSRLKFDKKSLNQIVDGFKCASFNEITIKIPNEYSTFDKKEFTYEEFINLNYNFTSQILIAKNENETIKILFINNSNSEANFLDITFPSSNSELSKYYIEVTDPTRIIGIKDFLDFLLKESSLRSYSVAKMQTFLMLVTSLYIGFFPIFAMNLKPMFNLQNSSYVHFKDNILWFLVSLFISLSYIFFYKINPGGLYLNKFEHPIISFTKRIFIGDLKDNLIISFITWIIKLIFGGIIVNILWEILKDYFTNV